MKFHHNLIVAWAKQPDGTGVWQYDERDKEWCIARHPTWHHENKYALVGKYEEASKAFALGTQIECKLVNLNTWLKTDKPTWDDFYDYRIAKPFEPKQGDEILVADLPEDDFLKREFIAMTDEDNYLCWTVDKRDATYWIHAKEK